MFGQKVGTQGGLDEHVPTIGLLAQGGQHPPFRANRCEAFADIALQDGVRADFDEAAAAKLSEGGDGRGELHGLAHVVPPVLCIQLIAVKYAAGDCRDEGSSCRSAGFQPGQASEQRLSDRVHLAAVEGIVELEQAEKDTLGRKMRLGTFQIGQAA